MEMVVEITQGFFFGPQWSSPNMEDFSHSSVILSESYHDLEDGSSRI
jgi:hypothetical protein